MGKNLNIGVRKAVEAAGGTYQALAEKLNCSPEAVRKMQWVNCTAERAVEIEKAVGVPREEIRPDIFLKDAPPKKNAVPALAVQKEMRCDKTPKPPKRSARVQTFGPEDGQIIEPVPNSKDISSDPENPAAIDDGDRVLKIPTTLKQAPNVDIARPGRLLRVAAAEQTKTKNGGHDER